MQNLTPQEIVDQLDKYIIGQGPAKRAVAVAIRNRWRRRHLDETIASDVYPKNIIMIGPTGVGKTEIARRLATLTGAPFMKVEASKFTEVGYHGRDVESMVRDLVEQAVNMVRTEEAQRVKIKATEAAEERIVDLLLPGKASSSGSGSALAKLGPAALDEDYGSPEEDESEKRRRAVRERLREQLVSGQLDERQVELSVTSRPSTQVMFANMGMDQMDPDMANMFERLIPEQSKRRKVTVTEARQILIEEETEKLLDREKITATAIERAASEGIIFLDEIDKITVAGGASGDGGGRGPDVSRQGVQRDLLPIVEGSTVQTRYGPVQTDHILFVAAGAFHNTSVSDLMPELQGRFPIRVELSALNQADFVRILTEPSSSLTRQQQALLGVEGLEVEFDPEAIEAMAELAATANTTMENIGARRLMTIVERVFEDVNFDASERVARGEKILRITAAMVREQVAQVIKDEELSRFVL